MEEPDRRNAPESTPSEGRLLTAERVYRELKRRVLDNELSPGQSYLEQELAALLGVSRTPVREAMVRMAKEGMVEIRPRHGLRVLPVSADDMREIYEILTALESEAAELVARQGLPPDRLAAMRAAVTDMDRALAEDDLSAWAAADELFHRLLIDSCQNSRLRDLVYQFWDQAHRVRLVTLRLRPKPETSNKDHLELVEAIARQDAGEAREIHRAHRIRAGAMLVDLLRHHGLRSL